MSIKKFPLEAYGAAVSREELVQAALDEITKNYREASLSNVARSYGVSLAYVSECVRAQTGRTYHRVPLPSPKMKCRTSAFRQHPVKAVPPARSSTLPGTTS